MAQLNSTIINGNLTVNGTQISTSGNIYQAGNLVAIDNNVLHLGTSSSNIAETVYGRKTFNSSLATPGIYNGTKGNDVVQFVYDSTYGSSIKSAGNFIALGSDDGGWSGKKPIKTCQDIPDAVYFNTGITLEEYGVDHKLSFPAHNGVFATTNQLAPEYSSSSTYKIGQVVSQLGELYYCSTAISTAEAWNSDHWTAKNHITRYRHNITLYRNDTSNSALYTHLLTFSFINNDPTNYSKASQSGGLTQLAAALAAAGHSSSADPCPAWGQYYTAGKTCFALNVFRQNSTTIGIYGICVAETSGTTMTINQYPVSHSGSVGTGVIKDIVTEC